MSRLHDEKKHAFAVLGVAGEHDGINPDAPRLRGIISKLIDALDDERDLQSKVDWARDRTGLSRLRVTHDLDLTIRRIDTACDLLRAFLESQAQASVQRERMVHLLREAAHLAAIRYDGGRLTIDGKLVYPAPEAGFGDSDAPPYPDPPF